MSTVGHGRPLPRESQEEFAEKGNKRLTNTYKSESYLHYSDQGQCKALIWRRIVFIIHTRRKLRKRKRMGVETRQNKRVAVQWLNMLLVVRISISEAYCYSIPTFWRGEGRGEGRRRGATFVRVSWHRINVTLAFMSYHRMLVCLLKKERGYCTRGYWLDS